MIVACADARVDPGILTQTKPGEIFTVRNMAGDGAAGAVSRPSAATTARRRPSSSPCAASASSSGRAGPCALRRHRRLVDGRESVYADYDYLSTWTSIAQDARDLVVRELAGHRLRQDPGIDPGIGAGHDQDLGGLAFRRQTIEEVEMLAVVAQMEVREAFRSRSNAMMSPTRLRMAGQTMMAPTSIQSAV